MKQPSRLVVRREALTDLTVEELARAGAGNAPPTFQHENCSTYDVLLQVTLHPHCSWSCID